MTEFQITLTAARVNAGYTQQDVADKMKVSKHTIGNWENGKIHPKPAQMNMMCQIYDIPPNLVKIK